MRASTRSLAFVANVLLSLSHIPRTGTKLSLRSCLVQFPRRHLVGNPVNKDQKEAIVYGDGEGLHQEGFVGSLTSSANSGYALEASRWRTLDTPEKLPWRCSPSSVRSLRDGCW